MTRETAGLEQRLRIRTRRTTAGLAVLDALVAAVTARRDALPS